VIHGFNFSKLVILSALICTYSYASNSHILTYQGPILQVCGAHPIKLIVTGHFLDHSIKGKTQK